MGQAKLRRELGSVAAKAPIYVVATSHGVFSIRAYNTRAEAERALKRYRKRPRKNPLPADMFVREATARERREFARARRTARGAPIGVDRALVALL
jgi:hypothetical protein